MEFEFDSAKDEANVAKHGVSLADADRVEVRAIVEDTRVDYGEVRYNAFGTIEGVPYCFTFTLRDGAVRIISLRRVRLKEYRRHVV